ncbi:MAG: VOC family protein [Planctomycetes bacterium]|nr:VOC family protein [Planctomycetota bacterium]
MSFLRAVATCLWFDGRVEEAALFYVPLVPGSELGPVLRTDDGAALVVELGLGGARYQLLNGGPRFRLDEAASIVVHTADQAETDRYWHAVRCDGGEESRCGSCRDRFGVWWKVDADATMRCQAASPRTLSGAVERSRFLPTALRGTGVQQSDVESGRALAVAGIGSSGPDRARWVSRPLLSGRESSRGCSSRRPGPSSRLGGCRE